MTDISDYDNRETEAGAADKDGLQPMVIIKKGLDLPIGGTPDQTIDPGRAPRSAAVLGVDYPGLRPTMEVREGDVVRRGQVLFTDKKNPGVRFVAPVAGTVRQINRGAKRALQSVVIDAGEDAAESVPSFTQDSARSIERARLIEILNQTGLFTAIRRRPFAKVPPLDAVPDALFVTAMDTNPLAADANVVIGEQSEAFALGVDVLARLTEGPVYVCHAPDTTLSRVHGWQCARRIVRRNPPGRTARNSHTFSASGECDPIRLVRRLPGRDCNREYAVGWRGRFRACDLTCGTGRGESETGAHTAWRRPHRTHCRRAARGKSAGDLGTDPLWAHRRRTARLPWAIPRPGVAAPRGPRTTPLRLPDTWIRTALGVPDLSRAGG